MKPIGQPYEEESLAAVFNRCGLSPHSKANPIDTSSIREEEDRALSPINKGWDTLDEIQKAQTGFLVLKGQHKLLLL
jgi:hypothetical protein